MLTGAVGFPLPGVEVRIVMNNTTNTMIVEGTHKETQVINEWAAKAGCTECSFVHVGMIALAFVAAILI